MRCPATCRIFEAQTIVAHCCHGRRQFVNVASSFPNECLYVLELLKQVYKNDALAKAQEMTARQRLAFHQAHSESVMEQLKSWLAAQIEHESRAQQRAGRSDHLHAQALGAPHAFSPPTRSAFRQ
jgi:hypothetical protein